MGFSLKKWIDGPEDEIDTSVDNDNPYYLTSPEEALAENNGGTKMILMEPRAYSESQQIVDHLKHRNPVVVNLKRVTSDQAKRIIDFLSGTVYAIGGDLQKVGGGIFLCTPNNVNVQGKITADTDGKDIHDNNDINIERDTTEILSMINFMVKKNSILITNPDIAKEWHPVKNGNLKPEHTKPGSNKKVWWICPHGHEYQLCVNARTVRGHGCPYCSSHRVMKGYNDLESQNPTLAKEWDYDRNTSSPSDVTVASGKKVWWRCSKGHEWEATISKRSNGRGCPYCSGQKVLKGYNDLATLNPTLMEEWNYNKNIDILPTEVSAHSGRKVWWKCSKCNHEWQATIDKRSNGRGCPKCKNKK